MQTNFTILLMEYFLTDKSMRIEPLKIENS